MPIRGSGVHTVTDGSRMAIEELSKLMRGDPDDLAARWLLNLATMTLDGYPDDVPADWLIRPETFASDHDIQRFPNVDSQLGIDVQGLSGGAVMEDFDGDGLLDLMASAWGVRNPLRYFRNNGDGTFDERTEQAGLVGEMGGLNLSHADYDNDGDADLLVAQFRRELGFEELVRFEHHITETWKSIVRQPYDRRDELIEIAGRVTNISAKHEGGDPEIEQGREHPSDILDYFREKEEIIRAGEWTQLTVNFLDKFEALNHTARALTENGLSFVAAEKLHGPPVLVGT